MAEDPEWLGDYEPIEVNITSLTQLAKILRDEVELHFDPHAGTVMDTLASGVDAPARPGLLEWEMARGQYGDGRDRAVELLMRYRTVTMVIAEAAGIIAGRYRDSDQFARATVDDVHSAFAQAGKKYGVDVSGQGAGDA